ncbi:MAG: RrF2 family transcriptional regulator [Janthinobacterium lividum]
MIDVRFPTGLQLMLSLALAHCEGVDRMTSSELARGVGANPSLVRKLLIPLVQEELLDSALGRDGGVRLARAASKISLREIYEAIRGPRSLWTPRLGIPHQCLVSSNVEVFFLQLASEADEAVLQTLDRRTLADSLSMLRDMEATIAIT